MKNSVLEDTYQKIDNLGKFFVFDKSFLINSIKEEFNTLETKYNSKVQEYIEQKQVLNTIQNKYDLITKFLDANLSNNGAFDKFKSLIINDFMDFANEESSLAEEAQAILMLQDVEKRLQDITSFPTIYNKNIVAVGGGFSAGKSEFINSFFVTKEIKLPTGINSVTAIPTYITAGETSFISGYSYKGGLVQLSAELYKKLSHDFIKSLGFNLKDIAPVMSIETPMKSYEHLCFIDTPGYNPSNTGYTSSDITTSMEYLKHANTILWTIGIDTNGTIPASDLEFLENIVLEDKKIYIIANKADLRSLDDIEDILDVFEEILDEYDIEYEGISAYSAINKEEIAYRGESLFSFLDKMNNPIEVKKSIFSELNVVFDMYQKAITKDIESKKEVQSHFYSLELDLMEAGINIEDSQKVDDRLETLRSLFTTSDLQEQLKKLEIMRNQILESVEDIFQSLS